MICILDCETVPDTSLLRQIFGYEGSDKEVCETAQKEQEEKSGSGFLPIVFHQVVAISAVIADEFGIFQKVNSIDGESEEDLIRSLLNFIDKHNPKLVSYNGRIFDMPMLMVRAMKYNLSCPAYFEVDNKELGKSKWDNYRYRFGDRFHVDLMDHIGEFGAVRGLKLDHICSMAGLPGKYDVSGDQVMELYFDKELNKIKEYCESDVLNTYWLYLKYELLKGNLHVNDYIRALEMMQNGILHSKSYFDVFYEYIDNEIGKYMQ